MSDINSELEQLIESTKRYFMQQKDLFGNITYTENKQAKSSGAFSYPDELWASTSTLDGLNSEICTCLKCPLGHTRTNFVFGVGNPDAEVMFIGEAPGADEDAQGEPFVGRAGQLLNQIIAASQLKRKEIYLCNVLKCRPPGNRTPLPDEDRKSTRLNSSHRL